LRLALGALQLRPETVLALLGQLPLLIAKPLNGLAKIAEVDPRLGCLLLLRWLRWLRGLSRLLREGGCA
jgi:hypothetical protein